MIKILKLKKTATASGRPEKLASLKWSRWSRDHSEPYFKRKATDYSPTLVKTDGKLNVLRLG